MALTSQQIADAADALVQAEHSGVPTDALTVLFPHADVADAYAVGAAVTERKLAGGRSIKGHKVGLTSKAMRESLGTTEPDFGTIFDNDFVDEGSIVPLSRLNSAALEIELIFVLGTPLEGPSVNAVDVIRATDFVVPAIEVVDNRFRQWGSTPLVDSIADRASCGFIVVGGNPVRLTDIDPRRVGGAIYANGELEVSGTAAAVMGNPINAVAWLARKLHEFGTGLEPGHVVLSGSFVKALSVTTAGSFTCDFGDLGQISLGFRASDHKPMS